MQPHRVLLLVAAVCVLAASQGDAAPRTWVGQPFPQTGLWSVPGNWTGVVVPQSGDDLLFPAGGGPWTMNDLGPDFVVRSITVEGAYRFVVGAYPITIGAGGLIVTDTGGAEFESTISLAAAQQWTISPGQVTLANPFNIGTLDLNGQSLRVFTNAKGRWWSVDGNGHIEFSGDGATSIAKPYLTTTAPMTMVRGTVSVTNYPGPVDVRGGTLTTNSSLGFLSCCSVGPTTVRAAGTLGFARSMSVAGLTMSPGALLMINALTWYGALTVTGAATLDDATLFLSGVTPPPLQAGQQWKIISNDGTDPVNGTFAGLPEGSTFVASVPYAVAFRITYAGGDGNDVVLTCVSDSPTRGTWTSIDGAATLVTGAWDLTLQARVGHSSTNPIPTGTVTFREGTTVLGTANLSNGQATLTVHGLAPGSHLIFATYNGDSTFAPSTAALEQVIAPTAVPALSNWITALLALSLALAGAVFVKR